MRTFGSTMLAWRTWTIVDMDWFFLERGGECPANEINREALPGSKAVPRTGSTSLSFENIFRSFARASSLLSISQMLSTEICFSNLFTWCTAHKSKQGQQANVIKRVQCRSGVRCVTNIPLPRDPRVNALANSFSMRLWPPLSGASVFRVAMRCESPVFQRICWLNWLWGHDQQPWESHCTEPLLTHHLKDSTLKS